MQKVKSPTVISHHCIKRRSNNSTNNWTHTVLLDRSLLYHVY